GERKATGNEEIEQEPLAHGRATFLMACAAGGWSRASVGWFGWRVKASAARALVRSAIVCGRARTPCVGARLTRAGDDEVCDAASLRCCPRARRRACPVGPQRCSSRRRAPHALAGA